MSITIGQLIKKIDEIKELEQQINEQSNNDCYPHEEKTKLLNLLKNQVVLTEEA